VTNQKNFRLKGVRKRDKLRNKKTKKSGGGRKFHRPETRIVVRVSCERSGEDRGENTKKERRKRKEEEISSSSNRSKGRGRNA